MVIRKQIGWSQEANLMHNISLQLDRLIRLRTGIVPTTTTTTTSLPPSPISNIKLTWDDIVNVPVADPSSVSDWNAWIGGPPEPLTNVVVTGNSVRLTGGNVQFLPSLLFNVNIVEVIDDGGTILGLYVNPFIGCSSLVSVSFPNVNYVASGCFNSCTSLTSVYLPNVPLIGNSTFANCSSLATINIQSCTNLGGDCSNNDVFIGAPSGVTITIPAALVNCGGIGIFDGDILALVSPTIIIV